MKRRLRWILLAVLGVAFVASGGMLIRQHMQYQQGAEMYAEAESLVELPDLTELPDPAAEPEPSEEPEAESPVYVDPYADALRNMDFTALRAVNSDVLGWILIPGTVVSYPLVQGEDNAYYLNHTWKKWNSVVGAIFLECNNSPSLNNFNTIIYGHRMNNGSMFASLKNYKKQSYWAAHPYVYITDDSGSRKYEIFAAYEVSTAGETYRLAFGDDTVKQTFLDACVGMSVIETGVTPTVYDKVLTLSTCTGNGHATRWVVQAIQRGEAPAEKSPAEEAPAEEAPAIAVVPAEEPQAVPETPDAAPAEIPALVEPSPAETGGQEATEEEPLS